MSSGSRVLACDVHHMAVGYALFLVAQTIGLCSACAAIFWFIACGRHPVKEALNAKLLQICVAL